MAYKEYFDTRDFPHHYESIGQKQEYEVVTKTEQFDPVEYEQFKRYLEFQKEKEILMKYESEGLITIRRHTVPEVIEEKKDVSDITIGAIMLGGLVALVNLVMWVL